VFAAASLLCAAAPAAAHHSGALFYEDPQVFDGRAARVLALERGDEHVYPYACDPSYGVAIEQRERQ
jgi:hypothetical protein